MPPTENTYSQIGGISYPLVPPNPSLPFIAAANPILYRLLEFYTLTLVANMGDAWNTQATLAGRPDLTPLDFVSIGQALPYPIPPIAKENQFRFPLLQVYRDSETYLQRSDAWYTVEGILHICFSLPPLTSEQYEHLYPFLSNASKILLDRTFQGYDSKVNGGQIYIGSDGYVELVKMQRATFGALPGISASQYFPTVRLEYQFNERRMPALGNFVSFSGFDGYVSLPLPADGYNAPATVEVADFINAQPTTITGIQPASGSKLGGTFVIVEGYGFTGASSVSIGGVPLQSFRVVSDSAITGTTAPNVAGASDVAVTSPAGTATLTAGFSYV